MKIRYLTGVALVMPVMAALGFAAVQSHAQTTPATPDTPPPATANPTSPSPAAGAVEHVCEVDTTVDGKTTTYRYVIRKFDRAAGAPGADLPPPPEGGAGGQPDDPSGDQPGDHRRMFMEFHGGPGGHHPLDMARLDTDKDGKVSFAEFTAPMHDMFDHLDANHDGVLDASELPKPGMGAGMGPGVDHDGGPDRHWGGPGMHDMPPPPPPGCGD